LKYKKKHKFIEKFRHSLLPTKNIIKLTNRYYCYRIYYSKFE